jgi:iron complex outermembrane recepter protein
MRKTGLKRSDNLALLAQTGLTGLALLSAASPAMAQTTDDTTNEIIVTANKREEAINRVGLTIRAIGSKELDRQQIRSLQDIAQAVPSLQYTVTDQSTPVYTLRGIGFYDTSFASYPTVSVYMDQVPLPFPPMTTLAAFDLQRIEVLKGPQGLLFGNNATGGAINYIPAQPTEQFSAGLTTSYGRFSTRAEDGFISGPLTDTLTARVSFTASQGDGWQKSATRRGDENGAPDTLAGRLLMNWTPTENLRLVWNLNGWRDRSEPQAAQYVSYRGTFAAHPINAAGGPGTDFVPNATEDNRVADWSPDTPPRADNSFFQTALRVDYDLTPSLTLTSLSAYSKYDADQRPEGDGLAEHRHDTQYNRGYISSLSQELRIADNTSETFRWVVGANFSLDKVFEDDYIDFRDTTAPIAFPGWSGNGFNARERMENYALFANGERQFGDFKLKLGARHTWANRDTSNCVYDPYDPTLVNPAIGGVLGAEAAFFTGLSNLLTGASQPVAGPHACFNLLPDTLLQGAYVRSLDQQNDSWRVGLDWQATPNILGYFNIARGYKAGGFPILSGTGTSFTPVTQESVVSYEGGVKAQLFDGRLSLNAALFDYVYDDKQLKSKRVDPVFPPIDALVNIPRSTIAGVDFELQARPIKGLSLGLAATYIYSNIDEFVGVAIDGSVGNFAGSRIPYTPEWQGSANISYEFPVANNTEAFVGGQVSYHGATNAAIGYPAPFDLPGYTSLDLQAGVDFAGGRYRVMLWGKNVTDAFYVVNYIASAATDGIARFTGRPATYGISASLRY